ncbi:MAG: hypothetical protein COC24_009920 [Alphaproteobacteria bacterium]|nr:hypothetical protein [Alphaproteobacteria bacterium]
MTLNEMIALQPSWVFYWVNWLLIGAFILPLSLFIWKSTRLMAVVILLTSIAGAASVEWLYSTLGYVKLLGLPHIILWTPLVVYLLWNLNRKTFGNIERWIIRIVMATIIISLVFDYTDVIRYLLGETAPFIVPTS